MSSSDGVVSSAPRGGKAVTEVHLKRELGLFSATMIGIGGTIGAGIFVLSGTILSKAGPAALLAFIITGIFALLSAICYIELSTAIPKAGGGFNYVQESAGGLFGFTAGMLFWLAYVSAAAFYALGFAEFFKLATSPDDPEESFLGATGVMLIAILVILLFMTINIFGAKNAARAENATTVFKLFTLVIFITGALTLVNPQAFEDFAPQGFSPVIAGAAMSFIAFEGFDTIATAAEEMHDPEKTLPRAVVITFVSAITIYSLVVILMAGIISPEDLKDAVDEGTEELLVFDVARTAIGGFGFWLLLVGGMVAACSALNAVIFASSRVMYAMGREKIMPIPIRRLHPRLAIPYYAILMSSFSAIVLCIIASTSEEVISLMAELASLAFRICFGLVFISLIVLRRKRPEMKRPFKIPFYPWLPIIGLASVIFFAGVIPLNAWLILLIVLVFGIFYYLIVVMKARTLNRMKEILKRDFRRILIK
ncbi:MAG: APC family permease [Candidatus Wukongarchaeota archaeon]|nr:APC family permease [Candidatus Wukongarchaeota archaeon]